MLKQFKLFVKSLNSTKSIEKIADTIFIWLKFLENFILPKLIITFKLFYNLSKIFVLIMEEVDFTRNVGYEFEEFIIGLVSVGYKLVKVI